MGVQKLQCHSGRVKVQMKGNSQVTMCQAFCLQHYRGGAAPDLQANSRSISKALQLDGLSSFGVAWGHLDEVILDHWLVVAAHCWQARSSRGEQQQQQN